MTKSRGRKNCDWIEKFCRMPGGAFRGQAVQLTLAEIEVVRRIYDESETVPVTGPLGAYLALLHCAALNTKFVSGGRDRHFHSVERDLRASEGRVDARR